MSRRYQSAILTASYNGLQVPNAPTIGTATASAGAASVTFTAPSNVGGGAITSYTVISSPGGITGTGASSPVTVSGLTNGTAYTFTVVATNAYGSGPASAASNSVTPAVNYIEDVFSTYLYTGNGTTQTITNGINLSANGGLVWNKGRSNVSYHDLIDTVRGADKALYSNTTDATATSSAGSGITSFNSDGFTFGTTYFTGMNESGVTSVAWTFRKQPKFFDVVTYTGNGVLSNTVAHNLQSVPGCIIWKRLDSTSNWGAWNIGSGIATSKNGGSLNSSNAYLYTLNATPYQTSTTFSPAWVSDSTGNGGNVNGASYVAYLFATNAGGFGLTGTDNVISCGTFTTDGSGNATVNLGYEPQWVMQKRTDSATGGNWFIADNMRGMTVDGSLGLFPNLTAVEDTSLQGPVRTNATGFTASRFANATYIYIAIRRGPMKTPTVGTSVFTPNTATYSANQVATVGFPVDMLMMKGRTITFGNLVYDRLRGLASTNTTPVDPQLLTSDSSAEQTGDYVNTVNNTGYQISPGFSTFSSVNWNFGRAPGFMDVVAYTNNASGASIQVNTHNLGVLPELAITKVRNDVTDWFVGSNIGATTFTGSSLNTTGAGDIGRSYTSSSAYKGFTTTTFSVGSSPAVGAGGYNVVTYLFATLAGVSKVGQYTGTGAAQTINCGFAAGSRFVLIKRLDSTGNWNVWDSARGIIPLNDPYLSINLAAVEVTGTDYIDTTSVGFDITSTAPAEINASGGTFLFLAIA